MEVRIASGEADRELSSQADVNFMQDGGRHKVLIRRGPVILIKTKSKQSKEWS